MGICQQVAEAAGGIRQGLQSPVGNSLLNVLNAIGAADIGLRLGSGGQVGVTDLPGLLNTPGIPCYSPELGDTIYVTPRQWYGNGMSCEGLRDPDREEIERRTRELQEAAEARNKMRQRGFEPPPLAPADSKELEKLLPYLPSSGFDKDKSGVSFVAPGTLKIEQTFNGVNYIRSAGYGVERTNTNISGNPDFKQTREIQVHPGWTIKKITSGTSYSENGFDEIEGISFVNYTTYAAAYFYLFNEFGQRIDLPGIGAVMGNTYSAFSTTRPPSRRYSYQDLGSFGASNAPAKLDFTPSPGTQIPPTTNGHGGNYPINPNPIEPPEEPCMGGCSCGQMANQQQRQNQNLERLVKEIHKAIGADKFASGGYSFKPEELIEKQGKTIYSQNPGRGGQVTVANLLEGISAAISAHYHRSGLHRFPAKVPDSLIPKVNDQAEASDIDEITLNDAMAFQKWCFDQWEAATGQYPIEYEITDDGQKKKVKLWNQSEVLAEIFGMGLKIQEDADLGVQWGVRAATEASKSGNAALKALHLLQEFVKFSGALTSNGTLETSCTFSPDPSADPTKAEEMLKPSKQELVVTNIIDGRSILGILMTINWWSQISGNANYGNMGAANPLVQTPGHNINMPGDGIKEIRKKERANDTKWDEWKRTKQQATTIPAEQQPPGGIPVANIVEIPAAKKQ